MDRRATRILKLLAIWWTGLIAVGFLIGILTDIRSYCQANTTTLLSFFVIAFALSTIVLLWELLREKQPPPLPCPESYGSISGIVQQILDEGNTSEAVKIAITIQRALWISGRWKEMIEIGNMVEKKVSGKEMLIVLVDMIGWPNEAIGNTELAIQALTSAKNYAQVIGQWHFHVKAIRHLGGIEYRRHNWAQAEILLDEATSKLPLIQDQDRRLEMEAGIAFGRANIALGQAEEFNAEAIRLKSQNLLADAQAKQNDAVQMYEAALQHNQSARSIYDNTNDATRNYKVIAQAGRIISQRGMAEEKRFDVIRGDQILVDALDQARKVKRMEQIIECLEWRGNVYEHLDLKDDARRFYEECLTEAKRVQPDPKILARVETSIARVKAL